MGSSSLISVPAKSAVHRAGSILREMKAYDDNFFYAFDILSAWRSLYSYPIKTFRAFFEKHFSRNEYDAPIIAQRLKRLPSIIYKLRRYPNMALERMQDIGGIRVILKDNYELEHLYSHMLNSKSGHQPLLPPNDYINNPKHDGYRSLHQVYKYYNRKHPELNILHLEVQLRTRLQHSWATAVETLGIVEKSSFKTGEGNGKFKQFFKLSSALFSHHENKPILEEYKNFEICDIKSILIKLQAELQIFAKLEGLALSAKHIELSSKDSNGYHLMTLDLMRNKISLIPFQDSQLEDAEALYREKEKETKDDPNISVVLISAGNVKEIKKAYPNYFLDTKSFIKNLKRLCEK